ncbi:MAG: hypothetical protein H6955_07385 [Chromatiaceae bacterium]|nr:hypothetical protein [Chromatiaceae bacterium]
MAYDIAVPVALDVWKDPQNFVILHHVRDEAWTYFKCWESPGEDAPYIGCLHFEGVWHVAWTRHLSTRGYPKVEDTDLRSYYLVVPDSTLLKGLIAERSSNDANWQQYDKSAYQHYVVESHDYYLSLIASDVHFSTIGNENAIPLVDLWNSV